MRKFLTHKRLLRENFSQQALLHGKKLSFLSKSSQNYLPMPPLPQKAQDFALAPLHKALCANGRHAIIKSPAMGFSPPAHYNRSATASPCPMNVPHTFRTLIRNPVHLLAFGLGSGLVRPAPGTWGTALGLLLYIPLAPLTPWLTALFLAIAFIAGCHLCGKTARDLGVHDFGGIVWDEFVGIWLTLALAPSALFAHSPLLAYAAAFIAFRGFDILKPPPIRLLDRHIPGGFGIMIDDVLAALFAAASLWLATLLFF